MKYRFCCTKLLNVGFPERNGMNDIFDPEGTGAAVGSRNEERTDIGVARNGIQRTVFAGTALVGHDTTQVSLGTNGASTQEIDINVE